MLPLRFNRGIIFARIQRVTETYVRMQLSFYVGCGWPNFATLNNVVNNFETEVTHFVLCIQNFY